MTRFGLVSLALVGCGEQSWYSQPFDAEIPFEAGQSAGQVRVSLSFGAGALPPTDDIVSDALRVSVPRERGRVAFTFLENGIEVGSGRLTDPPGNGLNLLDLTPPCPRPAPCERQAVVVVQREDPTDAETLPFEGDYILSVTPSLTSDDRPPAEALTIDVEVLQPDAFVPF